jgi:hypothetical protein
MKQNPDVVGVHPALTPQSTTHWKQLIHDGTENLYKIKMFDNIFSCYRASWFNQIGRFDRRMTYAWGVDGETGYKSRRDGKILLLDNRYQVEKVTDIGYKMNRMNMSAKDRAMNAYNEMARILTKKYGEYNRVVFGPGIQNKEVYIPKFD